MERTDCGAWASAFSHSVQWYCISRFWACINPKEFLPVSRFFPYLLHGACIYTLTVCRAHVTHKVVEWRSRFQGMDSSILRLHKLVQRIVGGIDQYFSEICGIRTCAQLRQSPIASWELSNIELIRYCVDLQLHAFVLHLTKDLTAAWLKRRCGMRLLCCIDLGPTLLVFHFTSMCMQEITRRGTPPLT